MRTLIEACPHLDIKLLKKDLRRVREQQKRVSGYINIEVENKKSIVDYYFEYGTENDFLVIHYDGMQQRIKLAESELYLGTRSWLVCECERRVAKLYLPPQATKFKCRCCYSLTYELTTFSRNSKHGQLMYRTNRLLKVMNTREKIRSIFYDGRLTGRFNRFLRLSDAAGITSNREEAERLLLAINSL